MHHEAPRGKASVVVDKLKMLAVAVVLIMGLLSVFFLADKYHVNPAWVFMATASLSFLPTIGWDYRRHFKSPLFIVYLGLWSLVHGLVFVVFMKRYGWAGWLPAMFIELFVFYFTTSLVFRLDPDEDSPPTPQSD
jgi:hypothetical protein